MVFTFENDSNEIIFLRCGCFPTPTPPPWVTDDLTCEHCVLISFKGKACHLGFWGKFSSVITDLSETLSSNNDKCIIWWYSSENYSHRSQNMAKITKNTSARGHYRCDLRHQHFESGQSGKDQYTKS